MRSFIGKLVIGLAIFGAVCSARPASAQTFDQQIASLRDNIRGPWAGCFECGIERTLLSLLNGAQAAHNAGNTSLCVSTINQLIACIDMRSRDIYRISSCGPGTYTISTGGATTTAAALVACVNGGLFFDPSVPVVVLKYFAYTTNGIVDPAKWFACYFEAYGPLRDGLLTLLALC